MKPSLQLRLGHQLTMTPQLQQAIRLLQLSAIDIQREIQTAIENNPLLEVDELPEGLAEEIDQIESLISQNEEKTHSWEDKILRTKPRSELQPIETLNSAPLSLRDHLFWQMQIARFSDTDHLIAAIIIDSINDEGYLTSSLDDILATVKQSIDVDKAEVQAVLHRIQQFDPLGVGARNIGECLARQLENASIPLPLRKKACELATHYLELLGKRDYATLKRRLKVSTEQLQILIQTIQSLDPKPGTKIGCRTPEYIVPDVFAYKKNHQWVVELNQQLTPALQINQNYVNLIHTSHSQNQFLRHQLQEARWFLKSIENRNETLLKVARGIVNAQTEFLDYGEEAMKPLILQDIANALQLHESTISRITAQKYLRTPRGTFELKYFFSSHVRTQVGGECSATAIRALIKKMITHENPTKPLSDNKVSQLLAEKGINVARRTVTKYREEMHFPSSHERKKLI